MVGKQIAIAPERIAEAKQLYEMTQTPVATIAGLVGVSRRTLTRRIIDWRWVPRRAPRIETDRALVAAPPAPLAVAAGEAAPAAPPANASADEAELRRANAVHIQHTVATSLAAIDHILAKAGPADESGIERSARTLAAVARALQEMSAMTKPKDETPQDEFDDEDDLLPRDIDDIRAELASRLHALIDAETGCNGADRDAGDPGAAATGR
jgi:hypothetical protein